MDWFKRFHVGVALAPVFVTELFRGGGEWADEEALADALVTLADAIARRLDKA